MLNLQAIALIARMMLHCSVWGHNQGCIMPSPTSSRRSFTDCIASRNQQCHQAAARYLSSLRSTAIKSARFNALFQCFRQVFRSAHTSAYLVATTIEMIGKLFTHIEHKPEIKASLQSLVDGPCMATLSRYIRRMSATELSTCLWGLRCFNNQWHHAAPEFRAKIDAFFNEKIDNMSASDITTLLWAIANSGLNTILISAPCLQKSYAALDRTCNEMNSNQLAQSLRSLMLLNPANSRQLSQLMQHLFEQTTSTTLPKMQRDLLSICLAYHFFRPTVNLTSVDIKPYETVADRAFCHTSPSPIQIQIGSYLNKQLSEDNQLKQEVKLHVIPVDMYCHAKHVAIEVDGAQHLTQKKKRGDRERNQVRMRNGITTIRLNLKSYKKLSGATQRSTLDSMVNAIQNNDMDLLNDCRAVSVYRPMRATVARLFKFRQEKRKPEASDSLELPQLKHAAKAVSTAH